jgi:hypothetical protein
MQLVVAYGLAPEQGPLDTVAQAPLPSLRCTAYVIELFAAEDGCSDAGCVQVTVTELYVAPGTLMVAALSEAVVADALPLPDAVQNAHASTADAASASASGAMTKRTRRRLIGRPPRRSQGPERRADTRPG